MQSKGQVWTLLQQSRDSQPYELPLVVGRYTEGYAQGR